MKTIHYTQYGSPEVLKLVDVEQPTPKPDEVLVKIHAASVNALDWRMMRATPFLARLENGLFKPKNPRLGADIAGRVEAVGSAVTRIKVGDVVYGDSWLSGLGGFAEYVCVRESGLVVKPSRLSFEEAAAIPLAALTALQGLRDVGQIQAGQHVLINGASGGVGTFAVQIAKALGAQVTAVSSTRNQALVRSIGADHTVDYTREDFTQHAGRYDLIFCAVGNQSISAYRRALTPTGRAVVVGFTNLSRLFEHLILAPIRSKLGGQPVGMMGTVKPNQPDLARVNDWVQAGLITPVLDRCYPLTQLADAIGYVEMGRARGKVVISIAQ